MLSLKLVFKALAGVTQLVACHPVHGKVASLIPEAHIGGNYLTSVTHTLSLPLLPPSLRPPPPALF